MDALLRSRLKHAAVLMSRHEKHRVPELGLKPDSDGRSGSGAKRTLEPIAADAMNRSRSKPFSKYLSLWIPAFAGMTGESFRTIYRRYRRCCH